MNGGAGWSMSDGVAVGIGDREADNAIRRLGGIVANAGAGNHGGVGAGDFGGDEGAPLGDVKGIGLEQPDVAIDAGAFVEPTLVSGGVDADDEFIMAAEIGKGGDVVDEA